MIKKYILKLLLILFPIALSAQTGSTTAGHIDHGATKILDEISVKYGAYTTVKISYTYKAEKEDKVLDTKKGTMNVKGNQYYFTFGEQETFCDGVNIWNYQKNSNEISIFEYDAEDDMMLNPTKMLQGWKKNYRAKTIREEFENGKNLVLIDITPIKSQSYYRIRLFVEKGKQNVIRFTVYEKDNTLYTYYFDKFTPDVPIEDSQFKLDPAKYPGAEINDMR